MTKLNNIEEVLNIAYRDKRPAIIVEGDDDRQIFDRIALKCEKEVMIYPVEWIDALEKERGNCGMIIQALQQIQEQLLSYPENQKWIFGIIDADARKYRPISTHFPNEVSYNNLSNLFVLKYYSIETYFATPKNLKKLFQYMTYTLADEIDDTIIEFIEKLHIDDSEFLYYYSLECLQKANNGDYITVEEISYGSDKHYTEKDIIRIYPQLLNKKVALDSFAITKVCPISDIKQICKGKLYLMNYIYRAIPKINELKHICNSLSNITKCENCDVDKSKCNYRTKMTYNNHSIESLKIQMTTYIDEEECVDIMDKIKALG